MSSVQDAGVTIDYAADFAPHPGIRHVVFDFDGTLSLLRGGWADIMMAQYLKHLPVRPGENAAAHQHRLLDIILSLNGRPTIHQMIRLAQEMRERGETPETPEVYQAEFQGLLLAAVEARVKAIHNGTRQPDDFLVPGARQLLERLTRAGLRLYLLSGTHHNHLLIETAHLGIGHYFPGGIFGPTGDDESFTKRGVLDMILDQQKAKGAELLSFGDGPVEIQETRHLGGLAIAVASDETEVGSGKFDPHKYQRLLDAGAHAVIPDYRVADTLLKRIFDRTLPTA